MNIKCDGIVDAWLGQTVVTGCEVGIYLFTQQQPSSYILSSVCVKQNQHTKGLKVV